MISAEEETLLARNIRSGCQVSLEKLIKSNLRFVVSVAKQYQNQGLTLNDLINEGNLGLIKAARRFDETRGFKFISYAVWWIRQSILQGLAEQGRIVRMPVNRSNLSSRISKAFHELEQQYEREPSAEELSLYLEIDTKEISAILNVTSRHVSMHAPVSDEEDFCLIDTLASAGDEPSDGNLDHTESLHIELLRSLNTLTERQKAVICYFYGIGIEKPKTLDDIGRLFHITRERVRQIKDQAIVKLQNKSRCNLLRVYLG